MDRLPAAAARGAARELPVRRRTSRAPEPREPNLITDTLPLARRRRRPATDAPTARSPRTTPPAIDEDPTLGPAPRGRDRDRPDGRPHRSGYGKAGRPLNRQSPFYVGFFGAIGVLLAYGLWNMVGQLAQVITLLVVALFITLALNPLVEALVRRDIRRSLAVATVFAGLVVVFVSLGLIVVPPVVQQGSLLAESAPSYLDEPAQQPRSSATSTPTTRWPRSSRPSCRAGSPTATS